MMICFDKMYQAESTLFCMAFCFPFYWFWGVNFAPWHLSSKSKSSKTHCILQIYKYFWKKCSWMSNNMNHRSGIIYVGLDFDCLQMSFKKLRSTLFINGKTKFLHFFPDLFRGTVNSIFVGLTNICQNRIFSCPLTQL